MLSTAYLDYIVYIINIFNIETHIDKDLTHYEMCIEMLTNHKKYLKEYFINKNRTIFDINGNTLCAVLGVRLNIIDLADPDRDNRRVICSNDIQMGHIVSRCENCFTIHGNNIVMMTRRGNLIIGEHNLLEDTWISELESIIKFQRQ